MIYVSIDIETTGIDPATCKILQIGAVIENTNDLKPIEDLPKFNCRVEHDMIVGQPMGISMNHNLISILAGMEKLDKNERLEYRKTWNIIPESMVALQFSMWLKDNGIGSKDNSQVTITVAGKNFGTFDKIFLEKLPHWNRIIRIKQRIIDPAILCTDWQNDTTLPNLQTCKDRLGIKGQVSHDAVDDALDVVEVIRAVTNNYKG